MTKDEQKYFRLENIFSTITRTIHLRRGFKREIDKNKNKNHYDICHCSKYLFWKNPNDPCRNFMTNESHLFIILLTSCFHLLLKYVADRIVWKLPYYTVLYETMQHRLRTHCMPMSANILLLKSFTIKYLYLSILLAVLFCDSLLF